MQQVRFGCRGSDLITPFRYVFMEILGSDEQNILRTLLLFK